MSIKEGSGLTIKDLKNWADQSAATTDYIHSQIDNIKNTQDPGAAEKIIQDTMSYASDMLGPVLGTLLSNTLDVVRFAEPSFPSEEARKQQNTVLRGLIEFANWQNSYFGKPPIHYPDGPFLEPEDPVNDGLEKWRDRKRGQIYFSRSDGVSNK